jgi:hypothetical protein
MRGARAEGAGGKERPTCVLGGCSLLGALSASLCCSLSLRPPRSWLDLLRLRASSSSQSWCWECLEDRRSGWGSGSLRTSSFLRPGCSALLKNELRFQRGLDSSTAGGGGSSGRSPGEWEGGVAGPLEPGRGAVPGESSESSLLSEPDSEPESEDEEALPELAGASPATIPRSH